MSLVDEVTEAFGSAGVLSQKTEHFVARSGQVQMAVAVSEAIEGAYPLVVEASTGVGKTYSYLASRRFCRSKRNYNRGNY